MPERNAVSWAARRRWLWYRTRTGVTWPWRTAVEPPLARWLQAWHGQGAPHQADYYRCHGCRRLVTHVVIRQGGCDCGMSNKLSPAVLRWQDKVRLLCLPWTLRRRARDSRPTRGVGLHQEEA